MPRLLALLLLAAASLAAADQGRRVALVIGNANYERKPLLNPINDARLISQVLAEAGFKVILRENASRAQMDDGAAEFFRALGPGDTALVFYAGHAVQIQNENLLIPVDLGKVRDPIEAKFKSFPVGQLFDYLRQSRAAQKIIILDACRTSPVNEDTDLAAGLAMPLDVGKDTYVIFSTSPGKVAYDAPGERNSPFTTAFAESARKRNLTIDDMMTEVNRLVGAATQGRQTPWKQSSLSRRFYFYPPKDGVEEDDPSLARQRFSQLSAANAAGRWEEAAELAAQVQKLEPKGTLATEAAQLGRFAASRLEADRLWDNGDFAAAAKLYDAAYQARPSETASLRRAIQSHLIADNIPKAITALHQLRIWGDTRSVEQANGLLAGLAPVSPEARAEAALPPPKPPSFHDTVGPNFGLQAPGALDRLIAEFPFPAPDYQPELAAAFPEPVVVNLSTPLTSTSETVTGAAAEPGTAVSLEIVSLGDNRDLVFVEDAAEPKLNQGATPTAGALPLKVLSRPFGARIEVEGDPQSCETPCLLQLAPGRHVLKLARRGYKDAMKIVTVKAGLTDVEVPLEMKAGLVRFEGGAAGTPVRIDSRATAHTLPAEVRLPEGSYKVTLMQGANPIATSQVELRDGQLSKLRFQ